MSEYKKLLYSKLPTMTVEEYRKYEEEARLGYIHISHHPENENIVILCYTKQTVIDRRWNKQTMTARGLILDLTKAKNNTIHILAKPFEKFFNYGENPEYEKEIDFTQPPTIMEKMDGSLGISYFFDDEIRFATKGSFVSDQAIKATELWNKYHAQHENIKHYARCPTTYLVEIIYPENRIVVDYKGKEGLVMLGAMVADLFNENHFEDTDYYHVLWEAKRLHMMIAPQYTYDLDTMLMLKKHMSSNKEGWIVRYPSGHRLKIKGDEYMRVHKAVYGLSDKQRFKMWAENRFGELLLATPEEFHDELNAFDEKLNGAKEQLYKVIANMYEVLRSNAETKRDYASNLAKHKLTNEVRYILFSSYDKGFVDENQIKEMMFKNYRTFLYMAREVNVNG